MGMQTEHSESQPMRVLREVFGYDVFRGDQAAIIDHVIAGGDALVIMPTGGGKSLCYQIPALIRDGVGIVVSPLIALMQDQVTGLRQVGVRAAFINSALSLDEARAAEHAMVGGEFDVVYVAPERLCQPRFLELLHQTRVGLFAIDEAHCVSQWGHDFRPEYRQLSVLHERFPVVPRLALTATADVPTRRDIIERLGLGVAAQFIGGFDRPNIQYNIVAKQGGMRQVVDWLREQHDGEAGIIYCTSRRKTEETAQRLCEAGFRAIAYHAGLDAARRAENQRRFVREDGLIVVATVAFGMGIDKPDVRFVAHLDLPKSIESYYQETGRAGRDGLPAEAWLTFSAGDAGKIRRFIDDSQAANEQRRIQQHKLNALLGYCETTRCRRQVLLEYFGEYRTQACGNCDTCREPVEHYDGTTDAQKALSNVYRTGQRYGAAHLADVLIGSQGKRVRALEHDRVSTYGIGKDKSRQAWQRVYRQLTALGMLAVDPEYGTLRLTERARPVLRGEERVSLRVEQARRPSAKTAPAAQRNRERLTLTDPNDLVLFQVLRAKRSELAAAQDVPPYIVFGDRSLIDMVNRKPTSLAAMQDVHGVGQAKLSRYGQIFVELIGAHVSGHPASVQSSAASALGPDDQSAVTPLSSSAASSPTESALLELASVRSAASRNDASDDSPDSSAAEPDLAGLSNTARASFALLEDGLTPEQIAECRGLKPSTIMSHLAEVVANGIITARAVVTLSDEQWAEIEHALAENEQDPDQRGRLRPVFEALNERYDYGTIKCVAAERSLRHK